MPTIPPNNTSGLYGIDGSSVPIDNNITANNISATGNVTVDGFLLVDGSITTNSNFVGNLVGNVTGNIALTGSNTQVIFNDGGITGGSNAFTFNKASNAVSVTGTVTATGNITGDYILGNGSQLTGLPQQYSNANVVALMASFGSNTIVTSGNITGGYILGNGSQLTGLPQQYGNANVSDYLASGNNTQNIVTTAIVQGAKLQTSGGPGNITGANYVSANYFVGDGSLLTNINAGNIVGSYGNANVANFLANYGSNTITTTGNVTAGAIAGNSLTITGNTTLGNITVTGSSTINAGNNIIGNVANPIANSDVATKAYVDNQISSTAFDITDGITTEPVNQGDTITFSGVANETTVVVSAPDTVTIGLPNDVTIAGNLTANKISSTTTISATGNVTGGNISSNGTLTATGNAQVANLAVTNNANITNDLTVGGTIYGTFSGNISGNLVVPGANTEILYNNSGNAGASSDFTFDNGTKVMKLLGSANVTTSGNTWTIDGAYINSPAGGEWYSDKVNVDEFWRSAPDGYLNFQSLYANANIASEIHMEHGLTHLTLYDGTTQQWLFENTGNLTVPGNVVPVTSNTASLGNVSRQWNTVYANTISATGNITGAYVIGNGSALTSITGANVTGTVANATYANSAGLASFVTGNAQGNITSVGTLTSLSVTGNTTSGNIISNGVVTATGNVTGGNVIGTYLWGDGSNITGVTAGSASTQIPVKNTTASTIAAGTPVYATGTVGASTTLEIAPSLANTAATMPCVGLTTTSLGINATGYAISVGTLKNVNTNAYTVGQVLYVAPGGGLTGTRPNDGYLVQPVGTVGRVGTGDGSIDTNIWNYFQLPNLGSGNIWLGNANSVPTETTLSSYTGNIGAGNLSVTGNIAAGNISITGVYSGNGSGLTALNGANVTGTVANATYATTAGLASFVTGNAQGNITSVGTLTALSVSGNITAGNITTTDIVTASGNIVTSTGLYGPLVSVTGNIIGTDAYISGLATVTGNVTAGNITTTGIVTASNITANLQFANLLTLNQQIQTTQQRNPANISGTVADPGRIVIGSGASGNISPGTDVFAVGRGSRLYVSDAVNQTDNQQRTIAIGGTNWLTATANISNNNTRAIGGSFNINIGGGTAGNTWGATAPLTVLGIGGAVVIGNGTAASGTSVNVGNTTATVASGMSGFIVVGPGSVLRNSIGGYMGMIQGGNIGNALGYVTHYQNGGGTYTGNVYAIYHPGSANDFGFTTANQARTATNYYFLRNDDNVAQTKMGAMRLWHNFRYDHTTTTGAITIDKNNGQTQYLAVTGNITGITLSNFVTTASDGTNTDQEMDTVTLWVRQDATGRTITMPTGANYFYTGGTTTVPTTANSVSKIEFTAIDNGGTTQYLIDISAAYTST